jgi:hypothetical protein
MKRAQRASLRNRGNANRGKGAERRRETNTLNRSRKKRESNATNRRQGAGIDG